MPKLTWADARRGELVEVAGEAIALLPVGSVDMDRICRPGPTRRSSGRLSLGPAITCPRMWSPSCCPSSRSAHRTIISRSAALSRSRRGRFRLCWTTSSGRCGRAGGHACSSSTATAAMSICAARRCTRPRSTTVCLRRRCRTGSCSGPVRVVRTFPVMRVHSRHRRCWPSTPSTFAWTSLLVRPVPSPRRRIPQSRWRIPSRGPRSTGTPTIRARRRRRPESGHLARRREHSPGSSLILRSAGHAPEIARGDRVARALHPDDAPFSLFVEHTMCS